MTEHPDPIECTFTEWRIAKRSETITIQRSSLYAAIGSAFWSSFVCGLAALILMLTAKDNYDQGKRGVGVAHGAVAISLGVSALKLFGSRSTLICALDDSDSAKLQDHI